jgi:hypothetical protein
MVTNSICDRAALAAAVSLAIAASLTAQAPGGVQPMSQIPYATHDWLRTGSGCQFNEGWADVKTPGDGRTYSVGTIRVDRAGPAVPRPFSGADVGMPPPPSLQAFQLPGSSCAAKQVVVLQCVGNGPATGTNADQQILWQRYWYGDSNIQEISRKATNARAISVWPGMGRDGRPDERETRIAICGETYDSTLPQNQFDGTMGWTKIDGNPSLTSYPNGLASGYVAVYNGLGELLWSHQFFFQDPGVFLDEGACAITDVSIRVEETREGLQDVVTYCGISAFGVRSLTASESLAPVLPFPNPAASTAWATANGRTDNGRGQWDGIVGRISNDHTSRRGSTVRRNFHSVVGGVDQDGLWGISELSPDRFVVVGSTADANGTLAAGPRYPFQAAGLGAPLPNYCVGTVTVFDASATRTGGVLQIDVSGPVGTLGGAHTHLADVVSHTDRVPAFPNGFGRFAVVGTTDDPFLMVGLGITPTVAKGPGVDGVIATFVDAPGAGGFPVVLSGSHQGANAGGWCGIGAWNEYADHFTAFGHEPGAGGADDFAAHTFFANDQLTLLSHRGGRFGAATAAEQPVAMGSVNVLVNLLGSSNEGYPYALGPLGAPAGGGIAVDERGRVTVVGKTNALSLRVGPFDRGYTSGDDAVRVVLNMLPERVGRSDGTGVQVHNGVAIPAPLPGTTGRTTPTAALEPFGNLVGATSVGVTLPRMLIDWEGPAPSQTPAGSGPIHSVLIDRPISQAPLVVVVAVRAGVPNAPTGLVPGLGIEDWVSPGYILLTPIVSPVSPVESVRVPLQIPIPAPATFTLQAFCLFSTPLTATGDVWSATPAITFSY